MNAASFRKINLATDLSVRLGPAPGPHVDAGDYNAKHIGRDETQLFGSKSDDADNCAVDSG